MSAATMTVAAMIAVAVTAAVPADPMGIAAAMIAGKEATADVNAQENKVPQGSARPHDRRCLPAAIRCAYGEYGIQALEPGWITGNQIEAARIAMTRYTKRGGKVWIKIFPDKPVTKKPARDAAWAPVRALRNTGLQS